ncbi:MAG: thioredoxin domain-containing protein [Bdellovibrionales bacterium]|nr:thioredoxin domain-containing protein [Bdellovibrionales bacterium]
MNFEFFKLDMKKENSLQKPRTRHLDSKGQPLFTNPLSLEKSPYLLQHSHNPVHWHPWGESAFEKAKKENRPILLSIGYSTCHWCHVMEEESFEDLEIAEYINQHYVAVKVDKEERPDIDSIYMHSVQMMTGHGGWPLTLWLTPDKTPFYGGTYFPPHTGNRGASIGFLSLLKELIKVFNEKREEISKERVPLQEAIQKALCPDLPSDQMAGPEVFQTACQQIKERWDLFYGGIRGAPKFPSSFPFRFLIRSGMKTKDKSVLQAVRIFLTGMQRGGLQDHVGGGFHRYSTDEKWLVPHFEKMLYDQALLSVAYLEAFQFFSEKSYGRTAQDILDYVMRDMTSPGGGFYSATDADSLSPEGKMGEGYYFTWTPEEVDQVLDEKSSAFIKEYYGMTKEGNFEGRNIFFISGELETVAKKLSLSVPEADQLLETCWKKLYQARQKRPLPLRDEKVLSGWNGLMISAFVYGFVVLNEKKYLEQGEKTAQFILDHMFKKGRLCRSWKEGTAYGSAYLDDYTFFIAALLDLFEWTGNIKWFKEAVRLDQVLETEYEDQEKGGFFMTAHDHEKLIAREKPFYDGAEPSGNSVMVSNLLRFSQLTGKSSYKQRAEKVLKAFSSLVKNSPLSFSELLVSLDRYHSRTPEIVLALPKNQDPHSDPLFKELKKRYLPHKTLFLTFDSEEEEKQKLLPPLQQKTALKGKTTVYICEEGACHFPTSDLTEMKKQLEEF